MDLSFSSKMKPPKITITCDDETICEGSTEQKLLADYNRYEDDNPLNLYLSILYCKLVVILGIALPITQLLTNEVPNAFYQSFYIYLYAISILFVCFVYVISFHQAEEYNIQESRHIKRRATSFGSFYLRIGAISFGIGSMVYSGLEFGFYFELYDQSSCGDIFELIKPICRMSLYVVQIQVLFLNKRYLDMESSKATSRFGLMHMLATNICEWVYVLVEETKHDIHNLANEMHLKEHDNSTSQCTTIIGPLLHDSSVFLFPCIIEYTLICAVILYEMWKTLNSTEKGEKEDDSSICRMAIEHKQFLENNCSRASFGIFFGVLTIVGTIISVIMYFVLYEVNYNVAKEEVTVWEFCLYIITSAVVILIMIVIRKFRYVKQNESMVVDCKILILAQIGAYLYGFFNILAACFNPNDDTTSRVECLIDEICGLLQTSLQTLLILSACKKRCPEKGKNRKPGRDSVLFLLVANIAMWIINTFVKGRAYFNKSHMDFYGVWAWNTMTHTAMPLAIFYRFHSTVCLYEIWKETYC
ncbi:hypothetical protein ACFFRR_003347 [Megaselia abdita]